MKKKYLTSLLTMAILATGGGNVQAQTDVTSSYLENPSFELGTDGTAKSTGKGYYSPYLWTATNLPTSGTKNFGIYSANETSNTHPGAFGVNITPDDGDYYFFGRESWSGSFDVVTLSQETKASLPAGKYLMSISYKIASKAASEGYIEISANKETTTLGQAKSFVATTAKTLNNQGNMEATPWEKLAVPFEVTEEGKITVSIAMHFNPTKNNVQQEAMAIDNVKIFDLDKASKDNSIDMSGLIMNQNFNISKEGWTSTTNAQNQTIATNKADAFTIPFYENWNGSAVTGKMYTTVNNLPNGIYSVGISAFANTLGEEGTQYVYAGDNKVNLTSTTPTAYTIENIQVTNGTLELGLEQTVATANWLGVDNVSLTYYGAFSNEELKEAYTKALDKAKATLDDADYANVTGTEKTTLKTLTEASEPTSDEAYKEATANLNNAISAFTDAKTAYDYYVANHESADAIASALGVKTPNAPTTAAEATAYFDNLNVAEDKAVSETYAIDLTAVYDKDWTSNTFGTATGQHWSGDATTSYPDKWSGSALTVTATKTVTLPAGKWVIKAAGRASTNATLTMTDGTTTVTYPAKGDTGYGIATDGTATFASDATYANDNKGRGWEWRFIPLTLTEQTDITITVTANLNNSWASFSNLTILTDSYVLDEDATAAPATLTAPVSVTYNRTFKQGWNSIVLPFATTPEELGADEAVAFTGTEGNTIKFETTNSLEANKPYMIYFAAEKTGVTFTGKTVSPAEDLTTEDIGDQYDFVGSYVANTNPVAGDYIVVTKGLQKATGGNAMKAFRAYFKAQDTKAAAKAMTISIDGQAVTGIDAINFNDALQGNEPSYNLAGQRVAKNYKGIVVRNGKKTINK
jgi:hypothetical protein